MSLTPSRPELDPDAARFLEKLKAAGGRPIAQMSVRDLRAASAVTVVTADVVGHVEDVSFESDGSPLEVRIYLPKAVQTPGGRPVFVFFHGGGWMLGSLDSHDGLCRRLCRLTEAAVVSVDYRLAPEHKFPAAVVDAETAIRWVAENASRLGFNAARIAVGGDSAGANLATVAARRLLGTVRLAAQVLWYPVTSFDLESQSYHENQEGYFLTRSEMQWFSSQYLRSPSDADHPDAAPLRALSLQGMPPAYILTAGYDPLRDDGRAYAKRLIDAGVSVHYVELPGQIHGFMRRLDDFSAATEVLGDVATFLRGVFQR